jgi:hypothetical protein
VTVSGDEGHKYFSFNNCIYQRSAQKNVDIFSGFNPQTDTSASYLRYNPRDFVPAAGTYYARNDTRDRIAEQFIYRVACFPNEMQKALSLCPDCDDVIVPLSKYDLYRILEVHFVRAKGSSLEVSRKFKFIGIDSSGDIAAHGATSQFRFAQVGGETLWAKWRGEISGRLYQMLGSGGPVGLMIRASAVNDYGCGAGQGTDPPPGGNPPPASECTWDNGKTTRKCGACGVQRCLSTGKWDTVCSPAADQYPCPGGQVCGTGGVCQARPSPDSPGSCSGQSVRQCGGCGVQRCAASGFWEAACTAAPEQFPCGAGETCGADARCYLTATPSGSVDGASESVEGVTCAVGPITRPDLVSIALLVGLGLLLARRRD